MVERSVRILSEDLARAMDRRKFLKRASGTIFAGLSALAAGHLTPSLASAGTGRPVPAPPIPVCNPPGPYCNLDGNHNDPNGCHGASCFQHMVNGQVLQCRLWYDLYQSGCWTTHVSGGYWVCCDCQCGTPRQAACGCAQWSLTPKPRPDNPEGGYA
jgi:hypothetical protein